MTKHFDAHCHVFNKDVLSVGLRVVLGVLHIGSIVELLDILHIDKLSQRIDNIINFLNVGLNDDSEGIYNNLQDVYENNFAIVPLMLDLTYVSGHIKTSLHMSLKGEPTHRIHKHLETSVLSYSKTMWERIESFEDHEKKLISFKLDKLESKLHQVVDRIELFSSENEDFRLFGKKNFQKQLRHLKALKKNHPETVYPFLSVDPRNPGILDTVKREVGKGKDFIGIKLYAPTGYSPTDPLLYGVSDQYSSDEDCLYNYCLKNDIPITAHCSDSGFATLNNSVKVNGYIYKSNVRSVEYVNKIIVFKKKIDILKLRFDSGAIQERASILNHPKIWEKVLMKFNNLRINLAHFGGADQLFNYIKYIEGKKVEYDSYSWTKTILELLKNDKYPHFFTDLSCFDQDNNGTLAEVKNKVFDANPDIQDNILYGSDYYLDLIFTDSFKDYYSMFIDAFKLDFNKISIDNVHRFLTF